MPDDQQTTPRPLGGAAIAAAAQAEQDRLKAEAEAKLAELHPQPHELVEDLAAIDAAFDAHKPPPPLVPNAAHEEPEPEPPADEEAARPDLAGKRVVLAGDTEGDAPMWAVLADVVDHLHTPRLYDGTRDEAIRAALDDERNAPLADLVRADPMRFLLVSVPASSWAPAPVKPKVTKTTWVVVR